MAKLFSKELYFALISAVISLFVYVYITGTISVDRIQVTRLTQSYALLAVGCLYLTLLATPLYNTFPSLPWKELYRKSVRGLGVSAFYFGIIHGYFSFFKQLGGFADFGFLSEKYITSIAFSISALILLAICVVLSFQAISSHLGKKTNQVISILLYLCGLLVIIHALILGSHFQDLFGLIPQLFFVFIAILLILQSYQLDQWFQKRIKSYPHFGWSIVLTVSLVSIGIFLYTFPPDSLPTLGIHAKHIQIAKEELQNSRSTSSAIPGLDGDKTRRYTVSINNQLDILPNQDTELTFTINQAESGNPVYYYKTPYEKPMHLIVVDETLSYFVHLHPTQQENRFTINTQFPHDGTYHLYVNFQPFGGIEQEDAFTVKVGTGITSTTGNPTLSPLNKEFGAYSVHISKNIYNASKMTLGQEKVAFTLTDTKTKQPVTNLKPYLNAFGHLVMINTKTYEYLHVHPTNLKAPSPNANGGPTVEFLPIGIYGPFKPGIYKVFAQFNPNGKLLTTDFIVSVQ